MECPLEAERQHTELPNGYGMGEGKALTWPTFCSNSFHANIYQPPTEACGALCVSVLSPKYCTKLSPIHRSMEIETETWQVRVFLEAV